MTVNSKEENSEDFCPNYDQEFGLWTENGNKSESCPLKTNNQQ